jgi:Protein-disulfide isomerase
MTHTKKENQKNNKRSTIIGIIFALILVVTCAILVVVSRPDAQTESDTKQPTKTVDRGNVTTERVLGSHNAKVIIIEYADYQCPGCATLDYRLKPVIDGYDDDEVALIFRHYPLSFHQNAFTAAAAAESAALQGKFWEMHGLLFENQSTWSNLSEAQFKGYLTTLAKSINLDEEKFLTDIESPDVVAKIDSDKDSAEQAGIGGTPTIIINDEIIDLNIAFNPDEMKHLLDELLEKKQ